MSVADIINFTSLAWEAFFPEHKVAPKTLCFDPAGTSSGVYSGLSHIAFGYDSFLLDEYDPDAQIYIVNRSGSYYNNAAMDISRDISTLTPIECIVFISKDNDEAVQTVLEKLEPYGIVIVVNESVNLPAHWQVQQIIIPPNREITMPAEDLVIYKAT